MSAQQTNTWYAFSDPDNEERVGFKDKNGEVRIPPRFVGFMEGWKFDDILAAIDASGDALSTYFLTKSGHIVGRDSLFFFDNMPDCENEGFIRFYDKKTDKVGVFNRNGDIVIPADYNALTKVMNGFVIGLKDAKKQYWDGHDSAHDGCNHYNWVGGQSVLLDTANRVLIEGFTYERTLDYYSLQITDLPVEDSCRLNFQAIDGNYYSFVHIETEFDRWLKDTLLADLTEEKLLAASYSQVAWISSGWQLEAKKDFLKRNFNVLRDCLLLIKQAGFDYAVFTGGLNPYIFESDEFKRFYTNCGESKEWQYPVLSLVLNHKEAGRLTQDHFDFLRTDKGYRLLSVSLRSGYLE